MKQVCCNLERQNMIDNKTVWASVCVHFCSLHLCGWENKLKTKTCYLYKAADITILVIVWNYEIASSQTKN